MLSRTLTNEEQAIVQKSLDHSLERYRTAPELAEQLITIGESKPDASIAKEELAAWTLAASQIFNLDETRTK